MNTPERWSTASSDSDLSSIVSSGKCVSEFSGHAGRKSVFVESRSCGGKLWRNFFIVGVLPLCFSCLLPNYSYFKEKADGKDWELRTFSTCSSRKLRFCTVSHVRYSSFEFVAVILNHCRIQRCCSMNCLRSYACSLLWSIVLWCVWIVNAINFYY